MSWKIKHILFLFLLVFITRIFPQTFVLAVIDFEGKGVSQIEASALTDRFRTEIINIGNIQVVERGEMEEILKEQGLQQSGCVTSECLVEVGRLIGVNQIVGGSISKVGNTFSVNARIIDLETGEIINSINYDYNGVIDELLISGMRNVSQLLFSSGSGGFVELDKDIEYYENGKIKGEGRTVANRKHGRWIYYHENGRIQEVGNYKNGKLIGKWTYYNTDGSISSINEVIKIKNKYWTSRKLVEYYESGNKKAEVNINWLDRTANGKRIIWGLNGDVLSEENFINGTGIYYDFYHNGQKKLAGLCKNLKRTGMKKIGKWIGWDENGNLTSKAIFGVYGDLISSEKNEIN